MTITLVGNPVAIDQRDDLMLRLSEGHDSAKFPFATAVVKISGANLGSSDDLAL